MLLPLSASHAHSLANLRKTPDEVVAEIAPHPSPRATPRGSQLPDRGRHLHRLRLHDPGPRRAEAEVLRLLRRCSTPASTASAWPTPSAMPTRCRCARCSSRRFARRRRPPGCGHFHDTRGLGAGQRASPPGRRACAASTPALGGIGGCPHAPGASGNVATEDLAYLFASMGVPTGAGLRRADRAARAASRSGCEGEPLHGTHLRAPACRRRCRSAA